MPDRYAIYFTFAQDSPMYQLGMEWLGHDIYKKTSGIKKTLSGNNTENNILTKKARQYGFHATLKAPFRLREGTTKKQLKKTFKFYASKHRAFECNLLKVEQLGNFIALVPQKKCKKLNKLANDCTMTFETFRATLSAEEIIHRKPEKLTANQQLLLDKWGYPFVMDEFRFHITLTDALTTEKLQHTLPVLKEYFDPHLSQPLLINQIHLVRQKDKTQPFSIIESANLSQ